MSLFLNPDCELWKEVTWKEHRMVAHQTAQRTMRSLSSPSLRQAGGSVSSKKAGEPSASSSGRWRESKDRFMTEAQRMQEGVSWPSRRFPMLDRGIDRFHGAPNPYSATRPRDGTLRSISYHSGYSKATPAFSTWSGRKFV
mmetsp:Transcript_36852/g.68870  ORF Transcript_36852/g.68870 Transcript_36852/m.68870 type:complete len:141 (+) Transcript_36852:108-530(+)